MFQFIEVVGIYQFNVFNFDGRNSTCSIGHHDCHTRTSELWPNVSPWSWRVFKICANNNESQHLTWLSKSILLKQKLYISSNLRHYRLAVYILRENNTTLKYASIHYYFFYALILNYKPNNKNYESTLQKKKLNTSCQKKYINTYILECKEKWARTL